MCIPEVSVAQAADRTELIDTLVLGFAADPIARWVLPETHTYLTCMGAFFDGFGGRAFNHQSAFVANSGQGVALWLPPDVEPDEEAMDAALENHIAPELGKDFAMMMKQMGHYHPDEPHWYLPVIAADPQYFGCGLGGELMKHALRRVDEDRLPAYLESSNPRNISLYERHGFEVVGEIQVGKSPVMTPMIRAAR
ncbi:GNAT family N-acetyltransferase [Parasphingorhabdus cellanae]|uniref:GNAT family N-acetyltransferase n=1 Tax=Parasphingorhabdus cellanae TaxID=2806553 RepID=A0ABX7T4L1_9SPHN|nr:N-acetyltransferase [Parasphingorhabdus cellanae]QTD55717.1 GNAT family N-acetyltransferase [Parasphingorhabdus cellanae]